MYFSAALQWKEGTHCIGVATADRIQGPFISDEKVFACPLREGAIDADGFKDENGNRFVVYKIDGNSIGHGGSCNNGFSPLKDTPIMLQAVTGDGKTKIGPPIKILDRTAEDGPLVEAPSLAFLNGRYFLFYSSQCWSSKIYNIKVAVAESVEGPYGRIGTLLSTGRLDLISPGGADLAGSVMVYHAGNPGYRFMYTATISSDDEQLRLCSSHRCTVLKMKHPNST